ncbi:DUF3489 domain-containing protein [Roseomonas populi]|uniref:DUF3489 domain-containing protein n=1 Tax=Roseomonas populi TaxID=3121582 RepID=A0ABT1XAZ9_9PROT|nr:DUF3489 domain-containing protein [Roseomonas pecuniae]MCR0985290.1 DUF3489 domain-containing protein [Roseomonas pecuniae]
MTPTKPLSPTQAQILAAAAHHPAQLAEAPLNLPVAARNAVFQAMLKAGLVEEVPATGDGTAMVLRITAAGLAAVGASCTTEPAREAGVGAQEGGEGQPGITAAQGGQEPPVAPAAPQSRTSLRDAATALLVAWDAGLERPALPASMEALRAALRRGRATRPPRDPSAPCTPRDGTKQQAVLTLLRRKEGATIAQVTEATGWAQHTVRGFLAGLKKKGQAVEVLERVRQVGPGSQGAKGSYSIYRIGTGEQG